MKNCLTLAALLFSLSGGALATPPGWKTYQAKDGSFSCAYPPKAKVALENGAFGMNEVFITVVAGGEQTAVYKVSWVAAVHPKLAELEDDSEPIKDKKEVELDGHKGLQMRVADKVRNYGLVRTFVGNGRTYIVYAADKDPKDGETCAREFLDSVQLPLDRSPLQDPPAPLEWRPYTAKQGRFSCTLPSPFQGEMENGAYWGTFSQTQRYVSISSQKEKSLAKFEAALAKNKGKVNWKKTGPDSYEMWSQRHGLAGETAPKEMEYYLICLSGGRLYKVRVAGPVGDPRLKDEARKIFSSFRPT